jgi:hypothetical protein
LKILELEDVNAQDALADGDDMENLAEIWSKIYTEDKKHIRETGWSYFEGPGKETDDESDTEGSMGQK